MPHPHSAFSSQNYCLAIFMRHRKSHVSRSRVPNRCIRLSGNYQPTRSSGPNRPNRFVQLSRNPPLCSCESSFFVYLFTDGNMFCRPFINGCNFTFMYFHCKYSSIRRYIDSHPYNRMCRRYFLLAMHE